MQDPPIPLLFKQSGSSTTSLATAIPLVSPRNSFISSISLHTHLHSILTPRLTKPHRITPATHREIFIPSVDPSEPDLQSIPHDFFTLLGNILKEAGLNISDMDHLAGKRTDVVDFGGEYDYTEQTWFQDRPERPAPVSHMPCC